MHAFDAAAGLALRLDVDPGRLESGRPVRWTFTVANHGSGTRTLTFRSGQQGDVVLEAGGSERYRWSSGRLFAAVISERELPAGGEWAFSLEDVLAVEPGTYSLLATVTAEPLPPVVRGEITVGEAA
jgi:Intracellular proteinase inhibitor